MNGAENEKQRHHTKSNYKITKSESEQDHINHTFSPKNPAPLNTNNAKSSHSNLDFSLKCSICVPTISAI